MSGATVFCLYDCKKGYYQKNMAPSSRTTAAILFPHGVFIPTRVIPGLKNATAAFQQTMVQILGDTKKFTWLDDTMTHATSIMEIIQTIRHDLRQLKEAHVKLNLQKCCFIGRNVKFLGRRFTPDGILHDPSKIDAITSLGKPETMVELNKVVNALNWARSSIPDFGRLVIPLQEAINKSFLAVNSRKNNAIRNVKVEWNEQLTKAYDAVIQAFSMNVLCSYPSPSSPTYVWSDASDLGYGGMVTQLDKHDNHHILGFSTGKFNSAEINWDTS